MLENIHFDHQKYHNILIEVFKIYLMFQFTPQQWLHESKNQYISTELNRKFRFPQGKKRDGGGAKRSSINYVNISKGNETWNSAHTRVSSESAFCRKTRSKKQSNTSLAYIQDSPGTDVPLQISYLKKKKKSGGGITFSETVMGIFTGVFEVACKPTKFWIMQQISSKFFFDSKFISLCN